MLRELEKNTYDWQIKKPKVFKTIWTQENTNIDKYNII